jgi:hypothetical protein
MFFVDKNALFVDMIIHKKRDRKRRVSQTQKIHSPNPAAEQEKQGVFQSFNRSYYYVYVLI